MLSKGCLSTYYDSWPHPCSEAYISCCLYALITAITLKLLPLLCSIYIQLQSSSSGAPDILCLQEVFKRSTAKEIVDAVSSVYPYYASFENLQQDAGSQRAWTAQEAGTIGACVSQFCSNLIPGDSFPLLNCSLHNCLRFSQISQPCHSCLVLDGLAAAQDGVNIFVHCSAFAPASDFTTPYGLLLLSQHRLLNVKASDFLDPPFVTYIPHGYISAEVCNS